VQGGAPRKRQDPAAAEALFRSAQEALDRGDWSTACAKFDASMSLDPAVSTLINVAKCHVRQGKVATAWAELQRALVLNRETVGAQRQRELETYAQRLIAELEPRLPKLTVVLRERPVGLRVERDGVELPMESLGEPLPADAGAHEVVASAPGYVTAKRSVSVEEGKLATVELSLVAAPPAPVTAAPTVDAGHGREQTDGAPRGGVPTWAWIAGGLGLALGGAAVAFRIDQASAESNLTDQCGDEVDDCPSIEKYDPADDNARKNRDAALFIGFAAGAGVALGAALVGIVTAPSSSPTPRTSGLRATAFASGDGAGASLRGRF
jgi:hypothetical protein